MHFIVITGGCISGLGKGTLAGAVGALLKARGEIITHVKIDPYINVDAGMMGPSEHGEVFVTADGAEVDLDIGHYERCQQISLSKLHSITTGKVYGNVINMERDGKYLGKTVQSIPHITDEIIREIKLAACIPVEHGGEKHPPTTCIVELGGTLGDIESAIFLQAISIMYKQIRKENSQQITRFSSKPTVHIDVIHISLVPFVGEYKTKPTQQSVKFLREVGIEPTLIVGRTTTEFPFGKNLCEKIELFCGAPCIQLSSKHKNIYGIPQHLYDCEFHKYIGKAFPAQTARKSLRLWNEYAAIIADSVTQTQKTYQRIIIAGKYDCLDAYKSLVKAIEVAQIESIRSGKSTAMFEVTVIDFEKLAEKNKCENAAQIAEILRVPTVAGIIVPGGFGSRGFKGKKLAANFARQFSIPFLGICYGFQAAIVDFAESTFLDEPCKFDDDNEDSGNGIIKPIDLIQMNGQDAGLSMQELSRGINLGEKSMQLHGKFREIYKSDTANERFRHKSELNPQFAEQLERCGMLVGATLPNGNITGVYIEKLAFYVAMQYHPEFNSKFFGPNPIFSKFISACCYFTS